MRPELPYRQSAGDEEYQEINEAIKRCTRDQFKMGAYLLQMLERGNYGPYNTFKEYLEGERRTTEVTGFRLIFAHKMDTLFREHGCPRPAASGRLGPCAR
jgi:hypothetical protein